MKRISIIGGRVIDPMSGLDEVCDVHIVKRRIVAIGAAPADFQARKIINAHDKIVCPGLLDLSVHLREPGQKHKATIASETRAAACNGITTVCCPPDTNPIVDTPAVAELLQQRARQQGMCRVEPLAALTLGLKGEQLASIGALKRAGCVGVTNVHPIDNTEVLRNAYAYAANHKLRVFIRPRDPWLGREGCMHEGAISTRLGLRGIPATAEVIGMARDLSLIELTGAYAHFGRLSSAGAVELLRQAQQRGLPVTGDVAIHQLFLTDLDVANYNSQCHVYPPLRAERDRDALREAVKDGTLVICSDHQPHEPDAKLRPFAATEPGISGLDTLLPLSLRLAEEMRMPLSDILHRLSFGPAQVLGHQKYGLDIGADANVCVIDPHLGWSVTAETLFSQRHNTPFLNWYMQGRAVCTLLKGRVVHETDGIIEKVPYSFPPSSLSEKAPVAEGEETKGISRTGS
jgi:dihydroorotase